MEEMRPVRREGIEVSRYPLSRRTLMHKDILAKIDGEDRRPKKPTPASPTMGKKRQVYVD